MAEKEVVYTAADPCPAVHIDSECNSGHGISWDQLYKKQFHVELQNIEVKIQDPPTGPIRKADLLWELRLTHVVRRQHGNVNKDLIIAQQCFIPTSRVTDFIHGMENSNAGATCRYVKIRTKPAKEHAPSRATETTPKEVIRYHCQYGPQDHSKKVKTITSLLLPKQRSKVLLSSGAKSRKGRKKSDVAPAEDNVLVNTGKKQRGRKKSTVANPAQEPLRKPKRTRKKKSAAEATTSENVSMNHDESALQPQCTTLRPTRRRCKPPLPNKVQGNAASVPYNPEFQNKLCNSAQSTEMEEASPILEIDLNMPVVDFPVPELTLHRRNAHTDAVRDPQCSRSQQKTGTASTIHIHTRRVAVETLANNLRHVDLNVVPGNSYKQAFGAETEDGTDNDAVTVFPTILGSTAAEQNTVSLQSKCDAQYTEMCTNDSHVPQTPSVVCTAAMQGVGTARSFDVGHSNALGATATKKTRDSMKQWGGSLKRGCLASFNVKTLYLLPHVSEICIYEAEYVNEDRVQCHGLQHIGDRSAFTWHLSTEIKDFVLKLLRDGHSVPQIMSKHIDVVKDSLMNGMEVTRDMFLHERDIRNLARKVARETYMLDTHDAKSVQLWVQQNQSSVFYYQEIGALVQGGLTSSNIPFTVGIQTPWQREMMVLFGHEGGVSIDATFGTNEKKFPLYTLMVFDEWHNGIPVAFVLTSSSCQEDLTPWMTALDNTMKSERPLWKPNAFIVDCAQGEINSLRVVWPDTAIFLCLWHVHRAWQKQVCMKIQNAALRPEVLKGLAAVMYDRTGPGGFAAIVWATHQLQQLERSYPAASEFWDYVREQWLPKVHMWVVGYRNLPYAGQDTNAAVESYHSYMKSVLKAERSRMTGRRVDWCIYMLTGDVLTHYWYQRVRKQYGFVENVKERNTVVSALIKARNIPDSDVTLPEFPGGPAYVTSTNHRHVRYAVHNPAQMWATCTCVQSQKGNTCKHKLKVLRLLQPQLAKGTIARYCGALKGTTAADHCPVFSLARSGGGPSQRTPHSMGVASPFPSVSKFQSMRPEVDLQSVLRNQAHELLEFVEGSVTLMQHLHAEFNRTFGKMKTLAAELESGVMHPAQEHPVFHTVQDGLGFSLVRLKDMLERNRKPAASRRLRMGGDSLA